MPKSQVFSDSLKQCCQTFFFPWATLKYFRKPREAFIFPSSRNGIFSGNFHNSLIFSPCHAHEVLQARGRVGTEDIQKFFHNLLIFSLLSWTGNFSSSRGKLEGIE